MNWKTIDRPTAVTLYNAARRDFRERTNDYDPGTFEEYVRTNGAEHVLARDPNAPEAPRLSKEALAKAAADLRARMRGADKPS